MSDNEASDDMTDEWEAEDSYLQKNLDEVRRLRADAKARAKKIRGETGWPVRTRDINEQTINEGPKLDAVESALGHVGRVIALGRGTLRRLWRSRGDTKDSEPGQLSR